MIGTEDDQLLYINEGLLLCFIVISNDDLKSHPCLQLDFRSFKLIFWLEKSYDYKMIRLLRTPLIPPAPNECLNYL